MLKTASLATTILQVVCDKATEYPFTGEYQNKDQPGTYLCRQCGHALFRAKMKFHSSCGWPSFDDVITNSITKKPDADGHRTEIVCTYCDSHLGHVFTGEGFTIKNTRHCVNSASLDFVDDLQINNTEEAIVAGGCFWGVEYFLKQFPGVVKTEVGYTGGHKHNPSYNEVCSGSTGHIEAVRVVYDPNKTSYEKVLHYFFEIHNPTQADGQGPDRGEQYLSAVFYYDDVQKNTVTTVINQLKQQGQNIITRVLPVSTFWPAEAYHQNYYEKTGGKPYCHGV
ncbi:MAG: peptide-methionine (S)-S-oxide reductase [Gammaproteobacteria bacterium RIFCSPHIGHO2_12_FULL_41_20]|nr:MAG: peptide-methionine (S)-S-oxide reductase [Gammaproteobacteria bacterium RIFCSPHIGHO2_12_FULL_41_20]